GVQRNTCSGATPDCAEQLPPCVLAPDVVPVSVPPSAGTSVTPAHVSPVPRVTASVATLFVSLSSGIRPNGSTVTRSVYLPPGTPVTSRYWQPRSKPYMSAQPAVIP